MKIVEFPEQTTVIALKQKQYLPMPVYRFPDDPEGKIICCWKLTLKERLKVAFTGTIWHYVLTFNGPLQPQLLATEKPFKKPKPSVWAWFKNAWEWKGFDQPTAAPPPKPKR